MTIKSGIRAAHGSQIYWQGNPGGNIPPAQQPEQNNSYKEEPGNWFNTGSGKNILSGKEELLANCTAQIKN